MIEPLFYILQKYLPNKIHRVLLNIRAVFASLIILTILSCDLNKDTIRTLKNFELEDINPHSSTFKKKIGPLFYRGNVSGYYFGDAGWGLCRSRFGSLNTMFKELIDEGYIDFNIVGINGISTKDRDYSGMINGRVLPWTQDNNDENVWASWKVIIRDFIILDREGNYYDSFNLTNIDLEVESNHIYLKERIIDIIESTKDWIVKFRCILS